MPLAAGTRLGPYEIVSPLGAGGMGEVYRARDAKLNRDVAIKVLLPAVANDPDRLARFSREAQVLASLNHPNIAHIYGLETQEGRDGTAFLVLEFVDGEELAQRIARGRTSIDEALPIARQIAEALEAAHEQGIIHRDLKPANIKVRPDGTVKVLDFGLAKAMDPVGGSIENAINSPTISMHATQEGIILGTAAYMSPEQARGSAVDKRADLWAFGVVLYEMLTGTRLFEGATISDTLAHVLTKEPDWTALPAHTPASIRTLLRRCLQKDRKRRLPDAAAARLEIDDAPLVASTDGSAGVAPASRAGWRRVAELVAGVLAVSAVAGTAVWFAMSPAEPMPPRVSRLLIAPSGTAAPTIDPIAPGLAITPDGSSVVYVGNRGTQLFVRALDALEPVALFTGTPRSPFVSPDNQWIGFVETGNILKKVAITGGPAVTLARLDGSVPRGATWGPDDTIIVATNNAGTGLQRVSTADGTTTVLTRPERAQGEDDHVWPERLPGGRAVLFTITAVTGGLDAAQVAILNLETGTRTVLVRGGSHAHYVPATPRGVSPRNGLDSQTRAGREGGHLVYAAAGTLRAVPFDLDRLETRGTPVPVVPDVMTTESGAVFAVMASDGTLAYVSGGVAAEPARTLVWVDRQGRETPIPAPPFRYTHPRLSPDGTQIVVFAVDREGDLWVWDLRRRTLTRATLEPGSDASPVWTPDGLRVIFSSERAGVPNLFWHTAVDTAAVERLTESLHVQNPSAVSPDGRRVIFTEISPKTGADVMQMMLDGTRRVMPLVQSSFAERNGIVSPDGRWLAYEANDSGRFEIAVRPFPEVKTNHWQVSTAGGTRPLWARSGQELFYVSPSGAIMRVGMERGPSSATTPTLVIKEGYFTMPGNPSRTYDIAPDGQRFLMIKPGSGSEQTAAPASLIVVQHWAEELKRLVPTRP